MTDAAERTSSHAAAAEQANDGLLAGWQERRRLRRAEAENASGMDYLMSVPQRWVTVYIPLAVIIVVLLFPFYWMTITAVKPNEQLVDLGRGNPFWVTSPTFDHIRALLFE